MESARKKFVMTLTPREMEVVNLLMEGKSNDHIGKALSITERTVRFHLRNVFVKLSVENRVQAVSRMAQIRVSQRTGAGRGR